MNVFNVFVKFLDWIVAIWIRLAQLIGEKRAPKILEGEPNYKNKIYNNYIKKENGPKGAWAPPRSVLVVRNYYYYYYYFAFVFNTKTVDIIKDMKKREMCSVSCNL